MHLRSSQPSRPSTLAERGKAKAGPSGPIDISMDVQRLRKDVDDLQRNLSVVFERVAEMSQLVAEPRQQGNGVPGMDALQQQVREQGEAIKGIQQEMARPPKSYRNVLGGPAEGGEGGRALARVLHDMPKATLVVKAPTGKLFPTTVSPYPDARARHLNSTILGKLKLMEGHVRAPEAVRVQQLRCEGRPFELWLVAMSTAGDVEKTFTLRKQLKDIAPGVYVQHDLSVEERNMQKDIMHKAREFIRRQDQPEAWAPRWVDKLKVVAYGPNAKQVFGPVLASRPAAVPTPPARPAGAAGVSATVPTAAAVPLPPTQRAAGAAKAQGTVASAAAVPTSPAWPGATGVGVTVPTAAAASLPPTQRAAGAANAHATAATTTAAPNRPARHTVATWVNKSAHTAAAVAPLPTQRAAPATAIVAPTTTLPAGAARTGVTAPAAAIEASMPTLPADAAGANANVPTTAAVSTRQTQPEGPTGVSATALIAADVPTSPTSPAGAAGVNASAHTAADVDALPDQHAGAAVVNAAAPMPTVVASMAAHQRGASVGPKPAHRAGLTGIGHKSAHVTPGSVRAGAHGIRAGSA